jgi:hypothetical protein
MEPWSVDGAYVGYPTPKTQNFFFFKKTEKPPNPRNREKTGKWPRKSKKFLGFGAISFFFDVNFKYLMVHTHSQVKIRPKLDQN